MTTTLHYPADVLRAVAEFAERNELDGDILNVGPRGGKLALVTGYASALKDQSAVEIAIRWARALDADVVDAHQGPENYHLTVRGVLPHGLPIGFTVLTYGRETELLHDMAIVGELTLDQIAWFVREPKAVSE